MPKGKGAPLRHHALNRSAAAAVAAAQAGREARGDGAATSMGQHSQQPQSSSAAELEELQRNEMVALESILGADFASVDLDAESPWRKSGQPSSPQAPSNNHAFDIIIRPDTEELKTVVAVRVRFRLPKRYPMMPPIITVLRENALGLSESHLSALQTQLTSRAKELVGIGEVMAFELYGQGQDYISKNNTESAKQHKGPDFSLEEEKLRREEERQKEHLDRAVAEERQRTEEERERAQKIAHLIQQQSDRNAVAMAEAREKKKGTSELPVANGNQPRGGNGAQPPDGSSPFLVSEPQHPSSHLLSPGNSSGRRNGVTFVIPLIYGDVSISGIVVGPAVRQRALSRVYAVEPVPSPGIGDDIIWEMESFVITSGHYSYSSAKRRLEEVEWELDKLRRIRSDSLANVLAASLITQDDQGAVKATAAANLRPRKELIIVTETVNGPSAALILKHGAVLPWTRVRFYLLDILNGLEALHSQNILHRDVSIHNVYLEDASDGTPGARLARAGYAKRMEDLNAEHPLSEREMQTMPPASVPPAWEAPEVAADGDMESRYPYTRKRDVWHTGILTLQMLFGHQVVDEHASPESFFEAEKVSVGTLGAHVVAVLRVMLDRSTRKRPNASELRSRLEETIRYEDEEHGSTSKTLQQPKNATEGKSPATPGVPARRTLTRVRSEPEDAFRPGSFWQMRRGTHGLRGGGNASRYENDFEELELLGKGAYGAVFKARNRLDGRDYAIKKIRLSSSAENDEKTLREITALSRLSHQNIVRYVTCWIQTQDNTSDAVLSSATSGSTLTSSLQESSRNFRAPGIDDDFLSVGHNAFSHGASHIHFGNSDSESDSDSDSDSHAVAVRTGKGRASNDEDGPSSGSSSSEEEEAESEPKQSHAAASVSMSSSQALPSQVRWLYIQMEYVENQTLKEAIDEGLSIEDSWRLFRQIVEALAHVASLGIIHRDLKPSNILMYGSGTMGVQNGEEQASTSNVKLGDFGLATTTPNQAGDGAATYGTAEEISEQTTDIGTSFYIAPEVLEARAARYDSRVDVYAAGIVFFEMLASQRVYKTGMERISIIRELRTPEICFPAGWNEAQLQAQTKLLRQMLSHDPAERPTPLEILKSELLPPKMEDEYVAECMRLLSMPDSTYNLQLMDSLFSRQETYEQREARDLTFDAGSNEGGQAGLDNRFVAVASQHLRGLFRLRGAVELHAPLLLPPNEMYKDDKYRPVELLDKTGKVVQLPFDLVVPFARMIARGEQQRLKRFSIANVYRPNLLAGGQPRSVEEVDYDIVAPEKTPAAEAEVLGVLDEILDETPGLNTVDWVFQISHASILDLLLERIPSARRQAAVAAVATLSSGSKTAMTEGRAQLIRLGLTRSILDEIESANLSDDIDVVCEKLERLVALDLRPRLMDAVSEIRSVIEAANQFGVQRRFQFTPLLVSNMAFYDSVYFVVVRARSKRRDVLASGGRYDRLLRRFSDPTLVRPPSHAVGVQISLGRIAVALAKHHETSSNLINSTSRIAADEDRGYGPFTPRRCEVYVASAAGLLTLRMEICRELWGANISADLAYEHALDESPELLASTCRAEGIQYLVIARSRGSMVKVKAVLSRNEYEVHRWELASWLVERLQRIRNVNEAGGGAGLGATGNMERPLVSAAGGAVSAPGTGNVSMQHAPDVEVLLPERYGYDKRRTDKHGTSDTRRGRKQAYLGPMQENAARQVTKLAEELTTLGGGLFPSGTPSVGGSSSNNRWPIIAVDVGPVSTAFHRLCCAALARNDEALWKLFMDSLSTTDEREYGRSLRQRISELQGRAWLVSIRSDGAVAMV